MGVPRRAAARGRRKGTARPAGPTGQPDELRPALPPLYSQEGTPDPVVPATFFTPDSGWTWYAIGFDGTDTCFGLVVGHAVELGDFRLAELRAVRGPQGRPVERALDWTPRPLSWVREHLPERRPRAGAAGGAPAHHRDAPRGAQEATR